MKYYKCNVCGNLIEKIEDGGTTPMCCNRAMTQLRSASTDGKGEKHLPVLEIETGAMLVRKVEILVGSMPHPSDLEHFICWIELETKHGVYRHMLNPGDSPRAVFYLPIQEEIMGAYAYCNLHGLWFTEREG